MRYLRVSDRARWPGWCGVSITASTIRVAYRYKVSRNLPSNTHTEPKTDHQKSGFSGPMQATLHGLNRAFETLPIASRSLGGTNPAPIYSSLYMTGYATIREENGFLYLTTLMMLASSPTLEMSVRMGKQPVHHLSHTFHNA